MHKLRSCYLLMVALFLYSFTSCTKRMVTDNTIPHGKQSAKVPVNYRQEMRNLIQELSSWAKAQRPGFLVVAQNSTELLTPGGEPDETPVAAYLKAIDGMGREELLYGYDNHDNSPTPAEDFNQWLSLCKLGARNHLKVLVTDYCTIPAKIADSYQRNEQFGFISFAATHRQLDNIPAGAPYHENVNNIKTLADAKNFLYYINYDDADNKVIDGIKNTNYDVLVIDAFSSGKQAWSKNVINSLKTKKNGAKRLVLAYMCIGQAEQYRWYWKDEWKTKPPAWLDALDPYWEGNYYVRYWMPEWKALIYGNSTAYTQQLLDAGFDGTYLDPVDGSAYWEEK